MTELAQYQATLEDNAPSPRGGQCAKCGAPVEAWDKFCNACGATQAAPPAGAERAAKYFRCKNCGAEVAVDPQERSYTCPFCDSNYVVEFSPETTGRQPPEFVIGFAVTPQQASDKFRTWLARNSWFRPGDLNTAQIAEKLKGVYLPFWSFSMLAQSRWSAQIGEHWYKTETYTTTENGKTVTKTRRVQKTEWWSLAGRHHRYYSGYLVSGSRGLKQGTAERIKPFQLAALQRYEPYFLAGWLAEEYSVARDAALEICQQEFSRQEQTNVSAFLPGDTHDDQRVETQFSDVNSDLILVPVYLLSYSYRDKLYRFLVNGQTGKAAGDKPVSAWRIALAAGLTALVVLAVALAMVWLKGR
jgi:hypothetical protein